MSHDEYVAWLMKIGMGWLGWKPDEVMDADMSDVLLAYEGKIELLEIQLGGGGKKDAARPVRSVDDFDAAFG